MARRLAAAAGVAALVIIAVSLASIASASSHLAEPTTVHVIEHATTDTVVDVGAPGDSTGDILTFHNQVFDAHDQHAVGSDQGNCIRIDPASGSWECRWVTFLKGGQIAVEGQFLDTANTVLPITGGTGIYANARGQMALLSRNGGTEFDFVFHVNP